MAPTVERGSLSSVELLSRLRNFVSPSHRTDESLTRQALAELITGDLKKEAKRNAQIDFRPELMLSDELPYGIPLELLPTREKYVRAQRRQSELTIILYLQARSDAGFDLRVPHGWIPALRRIAKRNGFTIKVTASSLGQPTFFTINEDL